MSQRAHAGASGDSPLLRFRRVVAEDLRLLALLQDREIERDLAEALRQDRREDFLGLRLVSADGSAAIRLFRCGLADLPEELTDRDMDILAVEYADIYLSASFGASPCESVWIDQEGLTMQEPMFQIRSWYERFGLRVADWRKRTDDHLVSQLRFIAELIDAEAANGELSALSRFMDEHLLRWIHIFADRVSTSCRTRLYAGVVRLTAVYLAELRELLAAATGEAIPSAAEIDARMGPKRGLAGEVPRPYVPGATPSR